MPESIELTANGWRDSAIPGGRIATVREDADPVRYPFHVSSYYVEAAASGSATFQESAFTGNPDGTGSGFSVSVPGASGNGVRIYYPFHGRCFGVRWLAAYTTPDFSVSVDGERVKVEGWPPYLTSVGVDTEIISVEAQLITHDGLDPAKYHVAEIEFPVNPDYTTSHAWVLYGLLLDRRAGYTEQRRPVHGNAAGTLTNSAVAIPRTNVATERNFKTLWAVQYTNTDSSARLVTIKHGATTIAELLLAATGADGATKTWGFGQELAVDSTWTHQASTTAVVNYQVIGGY